MIDLDSLDGIEIANGSETASRSAQQQQQRGQPILHRQPRDSAQAIVSSSVVSAAAAAAATATVAVAPPPPSEQPPPTTTTNKSHHLQPHEPIIIKTNHRCQHMEQPTHMSRGGANLLTCMLITANVGTIFEDSTLLELWFQQLKSYLIKLKPQLVAIHCQEVGGKHFETAMKNVSKFIGEIMGDEQIVGDYSRVRIFLDENFNNLEKFTALGSLYLVHDSIDNVKLYNFKTAQFETIEGRVVLSGENNDIKGKQQQQQQDSAITKGTNNTAGTATSTTTTDENAKHETTTTTRYDFIEKIKFPQDLFPECRWSRKGFMRTRWLFNDCQPLDLVNIHLFHDASNLVAMAKTPSPYAQNRQRALEFALDRLSVPLEGTWGRASQQQSDVTTSQQSKHELQQQQQQQQQVPLFIFGDFNFRLNTNKVIQRITDGMSPVVKRSADSNEVLEIIYHRKSISGTKPDKHQLWNTEAAPVKPTDKGQNSDEQKPSPLKNAYRQQADDGNCNYLEGGGSGGVVMTVGKKLFDCENLDEMFRASKNTEWLLELDNELERFKSQLYEFKISFSPSYPFKEDVSGSHSYMKTRCPAWCDRILFNAAGNKMIHCKSVDTTNMDSEKKIEVLQNQGDVIYRLMGNSVPMGDHKPVLLYCRLKLSQNSSQKCNLSNNTTANESNCSQSWVESTAM